MPTAVVQDIADSDDGKSVTVDVTVATTIRDAGVVADGRAKMRAIATVAPLGTVRNALMESSIRDVEDLAEIRSRELIEGNKMAGRAVYRYEVFVNYP